MRHLALFFAVCPLGASAATVQNNSIGFGRSANEHTCAAEQPASTFAASEAQIFAVFSLAGVAQGETLRIDWMSPSGEVASNVPYGALPAARTHCFVSQLPVAGFAPARQPGSWTVRLYLNGALALSRSFTIASDPHAGAARIDSVLRNGATELVLDGSGFEPGAVAHIARLTGGQWRYIHAAMPLDVSATRLRITTPELAVGEYLAVVRDARDRVSNSLRFVISTRESYKLPLAAGEPWQITQGPYGAFSHWGQALHAYDIAPLGSRCLVAMRGGVVHAFDRGYVQSHAARTFGNYITIDHEDGEYSHYAHLETGTFVVRTGQRVAQGQALAIAGNSGYTFPWGGGHHVHVHVTRAFSISAQSIPFEFEDLRGSPRARGVVVSTNRSPYCDCSRRGPDLPAPAMLAPTSTAAAAAPRAGAKRKEGAVAVAGWWHHFTTVARGSRSLEVTLRWERENEDVDLHLVSPAGKHYGWYGNPAGYSGQASRPERISLPDPEPGEWRVSVQGMRGGGSLIPFQVETYSGTAAVASSGLR